MKAYKKKTLNLILLMLLFGNFVGIKFYYNDVNAIETEWNLTTTIDKEVYYNQSLTIDSDITIEDGGILHLFNLDLKISANIIIKIKSGGTLYIENSNIDSILTLEEPFKLAIQAQSGSNITIYNTTISCIGYVQDDNYPWDGQSIWINTNNVSLEKNTFYGESWSTTFLVLYNISSSSIKFTENRFMTKSIFDYIDSGVIIIESKGTSPISIDKNIFSNVGFFIQNSENLSLENNTILYKGNDDWVNGLQLLSCNNIEISKNYLVDWGVNIKIDDSSEISLSNNIIKTNYQHFEGWSCVNITFLNNSFIKSESFSDSFIEIDGQGINFTGNTFNLINVGYGLTVPIKFWREVQNENDIFFSSNLGEKNFLNSKEIRYIYNISNKVLDFENISLGMLYIGIIFNSTIKNVIIPNSGGINFLKQSSNFIFQDIKIENPITNGIYSEYSISSAIWDNVSVLDGNRYGAEINYITGSVFNNCSFIGNFAGVHINYGYSTNFTSCTFSYNGDPSVFVEDLLSIDWKDTGFGLGFENDGNNLTLKQNTFYGNWYAGLVIGFQNESSFDSVLVEKNYFIQYIAIIDEKYSLTAVDNSKQPNSNNWNSNYFSDREYNDGSSYSINGSAQSIDTSPGFVDSDNDSVIDYAEFAWGSDAYNSSDTDQDLLSDFEEIFVYKTNPSNNDTDNDGLDDNRELTELGTDPISPDSDGDGFSDYYEVISGSNPNDKNNFPGSNVEYINEDDTPEGEHESTISTIPGFTLNYLISISLGTITIIVLFLISDFNKVNLSKVKRKLKKNHVVHNKINNILRENKEEKMNFDDNNFRRFL